MATALLVIALTLIVSFANVLNVRLGFDPSAVVAADVRLPSSRYPTPQLQAAFFENVSARLARQPGVVQTCAANTVPFEQAGSMTYVPTGRETLFSALPVTVSPGCFAVLGIPLLEGRLFTPHESEAVAIVSETYARRVWGRESAVGKTLHIGLPAGEPLLVVGVVADSRRVSVERDTSSGQVYQLVSQSKYFSATRILLRASTPLDVLAGSLGRAVHEVDAQQPVSNVRRLEDVGRDRSAHADSTCCSSADSRPSRSCSRRSAFMVCCRKSSRAAAPRLACVSCSAPRPA